MSASRRAMLGAAALIGGLLALVVLMPSLRTAVDDTLQAAWTRAVRPGPLSGSHAFLNDDCAVCHTPLAGVQAKACLACHAYEGPLLGRAPTAFHASIRTCFGCHTEHRAGERMPLRMDHAQLAGGRSQGTLDCATCHGAQDVHLGRFGPTCDACHDVQQWTLAHFRHPSPRSTGCVECHQAPPSHFMEHFSMVSRPAAHDMSAPVEACYRCHQTTAWNDIVRVGRIKHH